MSIELGLSRITKLLLHLGNPQAKLNVLHVAGTNGKGSVCSYLQSILQQQQKYKIGKFTSPHLCHITDSITVNSVPISIPDFDSIRAKLVKMNISHNLGCTEFELLTCTALQYFEQENCDWCVLEVGLGGRLDATNCIPGARKICGITKIGIDHEGFLGNTLTKIAGEKAGILTPGTKFIALDGTNSEEVIDVVRHCAKKVGAQLMLTTADISSEVIETQSWNRIGKENIPLNGEYQICNAGVALSMLDYLQIHKMISLTRESVIAGLNEVRWPGRLQNVRYETSNGDSLDMLIDGAHNGEAAIELATYLDKNLRRGDKALTFIIAVTQGKTLEPLLSPLIHDKDRVLVTKFGSVDGMPWIKAMEPSELADHIKKYTKNVDIHSNLDEAIDNLTSCHREDTQTVLCGSLYLCGELLKKTVTHDT